MAPDSPARPVFLAPHFDDVALSCGGTVAKLSAAGERPLIVTLFGGGPAGELTEFAQFQHRRWGLGPHRVLESRRGEDRAAARALGAEARWLDAPDAIYRGRRYTSDGELFGAVHADEAGLPAELQRRLVDLLGRIGARAPMFYAPLGIGGHVDHQHAFELGRRLARSGATVWTYEDFPYAGEPAGREQIARRVAGLGLSGPRVVPLSADELTRRIEAVLCYRSQLPVIFRHQGDPAAAIRRYALAGDNLQPVERFWRLSPR